LRADGDRLDIDSSGSPFVPSASFPRQQVQAVEVFGTLLGRVKILGTDGSRCSTWIDVGSPDAVAARLAEAGWPIRRVSRSAFLPWMLKICVGTVGALVVVALLIATLANVG